MMSDELEFVACGNCGHKVDEVPGLSVGQRGQCQNCGSVQRTYGVVLSGQITPRSMLKFKARHEDRRKPFAWGKVGSDLHRKTGLWMRLERVFDRMNDWYSEHISERETGRVIRHVEELLSEHRGHGSARQSERKRLSFRDKP